MERKGLLKTILLFMIGAAGYGSIEMIWRGRTHWSMMIAGGLCFLLFAFVAERMRGRHILIKAAVCALGVTVIEFIFGVIFNLILKMNVWDYSNMPFNILGQVCPIFTLMWAGIAVAFLPLVDIINQEFA